MRLLCCLFVALMSSVVSADTYTVNGISNAGISETTGERDTEYPVGNDDTAVVDQSGGFDRQVRVFNPVGMFGLLPQNHVILSATLETTSDSTTFLSGSFGAYQITTINAGAVTWNNQNTANSNGFQVKQDSEGNDIILSFSQTGQSPNTMDVTDAVREWEADNTKNLGIALKPNGISEHHIYVTGANAPEFLIEHELFGDSDKDGDFDSSDLVEVFVGGKYETEEPATFEEGDWNLDGFFDTTDFVDAGIIGHYEGGNAALAADADEAGF